MALATLGTGTEQVALADGTALDYSVTGWHLCGYRLLPARYEIEEHSANGVTGYGTKNHGQREASMVLETTLIRASETGCISGAFSGLNDLLSSGVISYSIAGLSGVGRLVGEQCVVEQPRNTGRSTYRCDATIVVRKLRN